MKVKILNLICILFAIAGFLIILAAGSSLILRIRMTDLLLGIWWTIPLIFLAVNTALYSVYAGSLALLHKGMLRVTKGRSGESLFAKYLFMLITAALESGVVFLLRYMIVNILAMDNPYTDLAAGGCIAACSFMMLAFIELLLGSVVYGCSWRTVCSNTEAGPAYLVTIGLFIEIVNIIIWCVCFVIFSVVFP